MNCPKCTKADNNIIDSRKFDTCVRRRRHCNDCGINWITVESSDGEWWKPLRRGRPPEDEGMEVES